MMMPGRSYSAATDYRYGFNGKENDNEVKGEGNEQDYGMRIYDPRLGRFLSVDPLTQSYPWNSPYSYAEGDPINFTDLDGGEQNSTRAAIPRPSVPGIRIQTERDLILRTRPWFANAAVNSNNPGPVPPNAGASRVPGGWYIETPNGGYYRWDTPRPLTPAEREWVRQKIEETRIQKSIVANAYSEHTTSNTKIDIATNPKTNTSANNSLNNAGGQKPAEVKKDDDDFASVRFQVQTGKSNISSTTATNTKEAGVTKDQGYGALTTIYNQAVKEDPSLADNKDFRSAIIRMSEKIKEIKGGISKGINQTTLQELFIHKDKKYRIDLEVQRGHNFKQ